MNRNTDRIRERAKLRTRGRSAVITLLAVWALTQFALGRAIDASLWLRDPLFADKRVKLRDRVAARTTAVGRPVAIVVVGSSRVAYAVRGDFVEEELQPSIHRPVAAVNFGITAAGPIANLLTVRRLVESADRPDCVILEVLPPSIANRGSVPAEEPFILPERLQHDELGVVKECGLPADATRQRWWTAELLPVYEQRFPLLGRIANNWLPWNLRFESSRQTDITGWQRSVNETTRADAYREGVQRARLEYFDLLQSLRFDTPAARAVAETLAICRRNSVRVAVLLMPEGSDFRSWYPPATEAAMYIFLNGLCRDAGADLIDARRWMADDAFLDSHHMLPSGAAEFSKKLARVITPMVAADER